MGVVILQNNEASDTAETGFTFGFEVNESLLAMSFVSSDNGDCNVNSDTLNNGDNLIIDTDGGSANKGLVFNQTFEDNEMMKKLLLCSESSHQDIDDSYDVVVESQSNRDQHPLKKLYCDVENLNQKNFNYDVIVHFVRQAWNAVSQELSTGSPVCYYSS